ncbi:hypothetical protein SCLCIDRAFT_142476, partial [Scleroderma citrinum Foug A]
TDTIAVPHNITEVQLLLATARADCRIQVTERTLANQVMQRDMLQLEYNRLQVAQVHQNVLAAELHVGHVRLVVRKNRYFDLELPMKNDSNVALAGSSLLP